MKARQDNDINSKFRLAAAKGELEVCQKLSQTPGININEAGLDSGRSALHQAVIHNHVEVVRFLVTLDVQLFADKQEQKTPIDYARENDAHEIMRLLFEKFPPKVPTSDLFSKYRDEISNHIVKNAAKLTVEDALNLSKKIPPGSLYMGSSLLFLVATFSKNWEVMRTLLNLDEDPNVQVAEYQPGAYQSTVLHMYLANEQDACIRFLDLVAETKKTIDFSIQDEQGKTAILLAAKIRRPLFVKALLERGAKSSIPIPDNQGNNILHVACILGDFETLKLIENHCDQFSTLLLQKNHQGLTPVDCLNLSENDSRKFIKSIFINPDRDLNAPSNKAKLNQFKPANISFLQACLAGRKLIEAYLECQKLAQVKNSQPTNFLDSAPLTLEEKQQMIANLSLLTKTTGWMINTKNSSECWLNITELTNKEQIEESLESAKIGKLSFPKIKGKTQQLAVCSNIDRNALNLAAAKIKSEANRPVDNTSSLSL